MTLQTKRRGGIQAAIGALVVFGTSLSLPAQAGTSAAASARTATAALRTTDLPTSRLIIKYRVGAVGAAASANAAERLRLHSSALDVAARSGLRLQLLRVGSLDTHVMRLERAMPLAEVQRLAREIAASDSSVEYAEPDRILSPLLVPNDTQYGQQWQYFEAAGGLNLPAAWDKSTGTGVITAVIDTGYRPHADLAANILPGYDFILDVDTANDGNGRDNDARDPGDAIQAGECGNGSDESSSWHGTHVAGTIAAVTNNGNGVAGVAFGAKVVPVRVLGKCGGYTSDIADGIVWASGGTVASVPAIANAARVINMSLGGGGSCENTMQNAINSARGRGTVVVVAAGNSSADAGDYTPASCSGVITVAATNRSGGRAYYSNYGSTVAVAAPGGDVRSSEANGILSTLNAGSTGPGADSYAFYQGTSMAAPHVAGVVALMLAKNPALTPDQVATHLKSSARPFPASCSQCGAGIVDASAAVDAAGGVTPPPPPPPPGNEVEPNDSRAAAQPVTQGTTINGTMSSDGDTDYFKVSVAGGGSLTASLSPNSTSDYDLYVYNSRGRQIGKSERSTGLVDTVTVSNSSAGTAVMYVRVEFYSGGTGNSAGKYALGIN